MTEDTKKDPAFLRYREQSMLRFKEDEPPPENGKFWACATVGGVLGVFAFAFGSLGEGLFAALFTTFLLWTLTKRGK